MSEISSDSEDDCYNFTRKLKKLKNKHARNKPPIVVDLTSNAAKGGTNNARARNKNNSDVILLDAEDDHSSVNADIDLEDSSEAPRPRRSKRKNSEITYSPASAQKGGKRGRGKRGRGRGRGKSTNPPPTRSTGRKRGQAAQNAEPARETSVTPPRRRNPGRSTRKSPRNHQPIVTYSVGNTDEYPDKSENQELFSNRIESPEPLSKSDLDEPVLRYGIDCSELLSVKVHWQHSEVFRFSIRRHETIVIIFEYFNYHRGVNMNHLLFTYNGKNGNRILKPDDTPYTIGYNIATFIEGGITSEVYNMDNDTPKKEGFKIKFQCDNRRQPIEVSANKDDKLRIPMVKCAMRLQIPLSKLVFKFDGEVILGSRTPNEMEMEDGDCIDVETSSTFSSTD